MIKAIGIALVAAFAARATLLLGAVTMTLTCRRTKIRSQFRQSIVFTLGIAKLDCHILVLEIASLGQRQSELRHIGRDRPRRSGVKESNNWRFRLLRTRG